MAPPIPGLSRGSGPVPPRTHIGHLRDALQTELLDDYSDPRPARVHTWHRHRHRRRSGFFLLTANLSDSLALSQPPVPPQEPQPRRTLYFAPTPRDEEFRSKLSPKLLYEY